MTPRIFLPLWILICLSAHAMPFERLDQSTVLAFDRTDLRFLVKQEKSSETKVLQVTSSSRFFVNEKYATTEQIEVGDTISGTVHRRGDGVYEIIRLTIKKRSLVASLKQASDQ